MIVVSGLGENGLDKVKSVVPNHVNVSERGDEVLVFSASQFYQDKLKTSFTDAKIAVADSDQKVY